jgi:2-phospho-L-lactate guanylyltransferase
MLHVDALVPVKAAAAGKARLADALAPNLRAALVRAMLTDVVGVLVTSPALRRVAVISPDGEMLDLAVSLGAVAITEPAGAGGLNGALAAGIGRLAADGAGAVLVVQGDVPGITSEDVAALLAPVHGRVVRAAPTADGGTSALLLHPPDIIPPCFGRDSFARHREAAMRAGTPFEALSLPGLAWDVDWPADIARLLSGEGAPATRALLLHATAGVPLLDACGGAV